MIVHTPTQKLVLNLAHPGSVVGVIPGARTFEYQGHQLVAVPHRLDETRVLRNLNIKAPAPIEFYYDFPNSNKPPMVHQKITAGFATLHKRAYILNEMGTAKTLSILWAAHYLRSIGAIDAVIVIAPLSTLQRTWGDEIWSNFFDINFTVLHGDQDTRVARAAQENFIYVINHDGVKGERTHAALTALLTRYGRDRTLVVIDETDAYTNARSDRWEALDRLITGVDWVWGASGSPVPTAPTDAWAQCKLITPWTVPKYFSRFRETTMLKLNNFKYIPKVGAIEHVHAVMQPGIRFTRAECFDLPPRTYRFEHVELTSEQRTAYRTMLAKSVAEVEDDQVKALNEGVKLQKLVQIACGVLYGEDTEYMIPVTPRVEITKRLIRQSTSKAILFVPLTGALDMLVRELSDDFKLVVVDGRVPANQRDERFAQFKSDPSTHLLVAHPGCMSHGLNLQEASTIIWYCPTNSNRIYTQANDRITRPGQQHNMYVLQIEGCATEREIYRRLETQSSLQGTLLAAYERQRTES